MESMKHALKYAGKPWHSPNVSKVLFTIYDKSLARDKFGENVKDQFGKIKFGKNIKYC